MKKDSFFKDWDAHESQWHKGMDTHFIETWYKNKSYIKFCLLVVASDPKWQKKEIKGRKKGSLATHPWCVELQWCSLSGSKPDPWCRRGAAVFQSPILGVIHVLANMSWWGFRRGREEQLNRVGGVNGLKEGGKFVAAPRIRGLWAAPQRPSQPKKQID